MQAPDGQSWDVHVEAARARLKGRVVQTPVIRSHWLSELTGLDVRLKAECLQVTGSFKARPALNSLLCVEESARASGVVTSSSGNFAAATAWAAREIGARATIVMTPSTSPAKVENTVRYGGVPFHCEDDYDARSIEVARIREETGAVEVHPHSSIETIAGDATCGLEILEQFGEVRSIVVPVSGGGLLAGTALACHHAGADVKVYGIQPEGNPSMVRTFETGEVQTTDQPRSVADGLTAKRPGPMSVPVVLELVEGMAVVSDEEILSALKSLAREDKLVVEPSGAVPAAAVALGRIAELEGPVAVLLSGGNVMPESFGKWV